MPQSPFLHDIFHTWYIELINWDLAIRKSTHVLDEKVSKEIEILKKKKNKTTKNKTTK
jgi:hypothetical protein